MRYALLMLLIAVPAMADPPPFSMRLPDGIVLSMPATAYADPAPITFGDIHETVPMTSPFSGTLDTPMNEMIQCATNPCSMILGDDGPTGLPSWGTITLTPDVIIIDSSPGIMTWPNEDGTLPPEK